MHTLFAGTSLVTASASAVSADGDGKEARRGRRRRRRRRRRAGGCPACRRRPTAAVCRCCTGFSLSQGELMQMIEFSQAKVTDDSRETMWALLLLLGFALAASGHILKAGLEKGDRTTHELLLKCVIIITSVAPRHPRCRSAASPSPPPSPPPPPPAAATFTSPRRHLTPATSRYRRRWR